MAIDRNSMAGAILVLCMFLLFILALNIYACFCWGRRAFFRHRHLSEQNFPRLHSVGLGKAAIEAIAVFVYQSENHKDGLESSVCLCEFEGNEKGRLLPKCHHSFHIDCIDMWFQSHSTCPLCRARAQPNTPSDSVAVLVGDEEAASGRGSETDQQAASLPNVSEGVALTSMEPDLDIDLCNSCRNSEVLTSPTYPTNILSRPTQKMVSSVSNSAFFDQGTNTSTSRKSLDKIIIDKRRRMNSFSSPRLYSTDDQ